MFYYYEGHLPWRGFQESQARAVNQGISKYINKQTANEANYFSNR